MSTFSIKETLGQKRFVLVGGTGFLGKVLAGMLLTRFDVGHVYLLVRSKPGLSPAQRFETQIWSSPVFDELRTRIADDAGATDDAAAKAACDAWLKDHVTPVDGDVTRPLLGLSDCVLTEMRTGGIDAIMNVAGVVSFTPPVDEGFRVNALGVTHLVDLSRALGKDAPVPVLHTSTCYVAGGRTGTIFEDTPSAHPFPRHGAIKDATWVPRDELEQGLLRGEQVRAEAEQGQFLTQFAEQARAALRKRGAPTEGQAFDDEFKKQKRKYIENTLRDVGMERAKFWGWPNTYTYTKSVGEQLLEASGVPYCIARPAIVESALAFPKRGWNEGINTSAPLIYMGLHGQTQFPTKDGLALEVIPVDTVSAGILLAAAELLRGEQNDVYQFGTADKNPLYFHRLVELTGLYKRRYMRSRRRGNPLLNRAYAKFEPTAVTRSRFKNTSAPAVLKGVGVLKAGLKQLKGTPAAGVARAVEKGIKPLEKQAFAANMIFDAFMPFVSEYDYRFRSDHARAALRRVHEDERDLVPFAPQDLDWRHYWMNVHIDGLRQWVFPHLEARLTRRARPHERFSDVVSMVRELADREGSRPAVVGYRMQDGAAVETTRVTYRGLYDRAVGCANRLADAGVSPGDVVAVVAPNSPETAVALVGGLLTGASVAVLDPALPSDVLAERLHAVSPAAVVLGDDVELSAPGGLAWPVLPLETATAPHGGPRASAPDVLLSPADAAFIVYTAGTSGPAKPVVLSHQHVTTVLASVAPMFGLHKRDTVLSVLPLSQSFELLCGFLLPLLRGAQVTTVDATSADAITAAFDAAGVTAMVGVPGVWERLEQKLADDLKDAGPLSETAFKAGVWLSERLGAEVAAPLNRWFLRPVVERVGGDVRFLVSTGAPVPEETAKKFRALGIKLHEGYGMTEAMPVLGMTGGMRSGGKTAAPGVELDVRDAGEDGIGEIVARTQVAPYHGGLEAPSDADGWLRTGDLGRVDKKGRVTVIGRADDVIERAGGHRVYPRAVEDALAGAADVQELCALGLPDGSGQERLVVVAVRAADGMETSRVLRRLRQAGRGLDAALVPDEIIVRDAALPRTASGGVHKTRLLAELVARDGAAVGDVPAATAGDVEAQPRVTEAPARERLAAPGAADDAESVILPDVVTAPVKSLLHKGQMAAYDRGFVTRVTGKEHIPHNRQVIVAANHASHLDMGLVKYALGDYGKRLVALAAKDYFFAGKARRLFFENFTNLKPLDRAENPREALRDALRVIESGKNVLIFPEGTRSSSGDVASFKPSVAYLAVKQGVDVLPVYLDGTHRSLPRGRMLPTRRKLAARIGPVIPAEKLADAIAKAGLRMSEGTRRAALVIEQAVRALEEQTPFDLDAALAAVMSPVEAVPAAPASPLPALFESLQTRFVPGELEQSITYYFSLGNDDLSKWTVKVGPESCAITNGKPDGAAECVMKTNVRMFKRIVTEHYIPEIAEFMDGTVKTNDPSLLPHFVRAFNL